MAARVTGSGVSEMRLLAAKLKTADPALKKNLRRRLKDAAEPAADKARRSILDMPAEHYPGRGLREEVAATITTSVTTPASGVKVTIVSRGNRMPPGKGNLPRYLDEARGWGHPVYADRKKPRSKWRWAHQQGKPGWFEEPIARSAPQLRDACERAIDDTRRLLGGLRTARGERVVKAVVSRNGVNRCAGEDREGDDQDDGQDREDPAEDDRPGVQGAGLESLALGLPPRHVTHDHPGERENESQDERDDIDRLGFGSRGRHGGLAVRVHVVGHFDCSSSLSARRSRRLRAAASDMPL